MDKAKIICAGVLFGALSVVAAGPRIVDSTVEISQDPGTRRVTVNYSLSGEPGIVTFSVMTNSVQAGWMDVGFFIRKFCKIQIDGCAKHNCQPKYHAVFYYREV